MMKTIGSEINNKGTIVLPGHSAMVTWKQTMPSRQLSVSWQWIRKGVTVLDEVVEPENQKSIGLMTHQGG